MTEKREFASIRILVVDDHEAARRGIRSVLTGDPSLDVVGEAVDGTEAIQKSQDLRPDIILLDITLPAQSGLQAAEHIRVVSPDSRIIFVSQHDSVQVAREAMSLGAYGYVVKSDAGHELLAAIEAAREGRVFVSRTLLEHGWKSL